MGVVIPSRLPRPTKLANLTTPLAKLLQPFVETIARQAGDPGMAAILDDMDIVCIAQATPSRLVFSSFSVGTRLPAYSTALGRVMLAYATTAWLDSYWRKVSFAARAPKSICTRPALERELKAVRDQGYAVVDEEVELGLRTIAVPIRNTVGVVVAALNVAVHASRIEVEDMADLLESIRDHVVF